VAPTFFQEAKSGTKKGLKHEVYDNKMEDVEIVEPLLDASGETIISRTEGFLSSPKTILGVSSVYLLIYVSFIAKEGGFSSDFLHFGPGNASFVGIKLDSWEKVLMMYRQKYNLEPLVLNYIFSAMPFSNKVTERYFISFISALMNNYYQYAMTNNLHSYIWNRAVPKVPFSKRWTYVVILAEPFLMEVLSITSFFTTLTLQLQFIIPQFIGATLIEIPFTIQRLREKEYEFD